MRRILVWILGALVAVVAIAWIALAVLFPPAKVTALVRDQISRTLTREVRFEGASVGLLPPVRLTVKAPALAEPGGFAYGSAFRADHLHLDLDVLALLGRRVVVRRLELDGVVLHLALRADGTTNFDGLVKPAPAGQAAPGAPMDLEVRTLALRQARVVLDDARAHRRTTFLIDTNLGLASLEGGKRLSTHGETRVGGLAFGPDNVTRVSALNQSLARLVLDVRHEGTFDATTRRLALDRLDVGLGRAHLALSGTVDDPGPRARLDLRARGDGLDFGEILGFLAAADAPAVNGIRGSGRMAFDLAVRGALAPGRLPELTGTLTVRDASFRYPKARASVDGLGFEARFAPDSVGVADLAARVEGQPLRGALSARRFADPLVGFALQGQVNLDAVAPLVAPKDVTLGGRVALDVRGSGRAKDPGSFTVDGRADLADVRVAAPTLPNPVEGVNGHVELSQARAAVRGLTARAGKSSFTLDATVTRPLAVLAKVGSAPPAGVSFTFDAPYLDPAELLPAGDGGMLPFNAEGAGDVRIARFRSQKLEATDIRAHVTIRPNHIEVPSFGLAAYGGRVAGNGSFGLEDPKRPTFALKGRADSLSAGAFLAALTPAKDMVAGTLSSAFDLSGDGTQPDQLKRSLTAVGLAAMVEGRIGSPVFETIAQVAHIPRLRELRFKEARLPFRIVRGQIVTDSVKFAGPECGDWKVAGALGFDGALDYAVSATLPKEVADRIQARSALAAGALGDDQGRMLLDLRVSGSAKSPRVSWNTQAMRDRLAGRATAALKEQSQRIGQELMQRALAPAGDSARAAAPQKDLKSQLKDEAGGFLQGLLGGKKKAPADTTKK